MFSQASSRDIRSRSVTTSHHTWHQSHEGQNSHWHSQPAAPAHVGTLNLLECFWELSAKICLVMSLICKNTTWFKTDRIISRKITYPQEWRWVSGRRPGIWDQSRGAARRTWRRRTRRCSAGRRTAARTWTGWWRSWWTRAGSPCWLPWHWPSPSQDSSPWGRKVKWALIWTWTVCLAKVKWTLVWTWTVCYCAFFAKKT